MWTKEVRILRSIVRGLRPIYIEDLGLATALAMNAKEKNQPDETTIHFRLEGTERRLEPDHEMALYRIAQEAINNAVRHAKAQNIWVSIIFRENTLELEIQDDGLGFIAPANPMDFSKGGHFGLLGIYERAELIGAKLVIKIEFG